MDEFADAAISIARDRRYEMTTRTMSVREFQRRKGKPIAVRHRTTNARWLTGSDLAKRSISQPNPLLSFLLSQKPKETP